MKRMYAVAVIGALALGLATWLVVAPAFAQGPGAGQSPAEGQATSRIMITVDGAGPGLMGLHGVLGTPPAHDLVALIAQALGESKEALLAEQKAGKSLDQIAQAHGTTKQALLDKAQESMKDQLKAHLDQAVAAGKLTREQADKVLAGFKVELNLDDLPSATGHGAMMFKLGKTLSLGSGDGTDGNFEFKLAEPADGEDFLLPFQPDENGVAPQLRALPALPAELAPLDKSTVDTVTDILDAAVVAGKLPRSEADKVLKRLDSPMVPGMRFFRQTEPGGVEDGAVQPLAPQAGRPI